MWFNVKRYIIVRKIINDSLVKVMYIFVITKIFKCL